MLQETSMSKFQYISAQCAKTLKHFKVLTNMPSVPKNNFTKNKLYLDLLVSLVNK